MTRLYFSNTANQTALSGSVVASDPTLLLSIPLTGWPASFPHKAVLGPDTASAEVVLVTAGSPTSLTVTRGQDGTSAGNWPAGTIIEHRWSAAEADEANLHANSTGNVHGVVGNVVGTTDVQTVTNKTLTSPLLDTATARASSTTPALAAKAAATGTANIQEWQDVAGVALGRVGQKGDLVLNPSDPATKPLTVKGATAQTANLLDAQDAAGAHVFAVAASGRIAHKPNDTSAAAVKYVPPNSSTATYLTLRDTADLADQFLLTTAGEISSAAKLWLRGFFTDDPIRYPLDGSKFKVDTDGDVTTPGTVTAGAVSATSVIAGGVVASGNVTANNLPQVRTADAGKRIEFGTFTVNFSADSGVTGTLNFPQAFSSATGVVVTGTVKVGSNNDLCFNLQNDPTASSVNWRVFQKDAIAITTTATVHWMAVGPA